MDPIEPEHDVVRRILHVDCDAFFVQVARMEDPEGAGRAPLLLVGGAPSGRGVVTSASYEARVYGVRSAMPMSEALRRCPEATVVSVPRKAVRRRSAEVRAALEDLAPVVEAASVDEFYLDLTGTERLFRGEALSETADRIRRAILDRTAVATSVGGGTNRLVAKLATSRAKPAGVHVVPAGAEASFMRALSLADIPGVGPALLERLTSRGLHTVTDALAVEPEWLERWLGPRRAAWLRAHLLGRGADDVDSDRERKSISSERTFPRDIDNDDALEAELLGLAEAVGHTLRDHGLRTRTVTTKLKDFDFRVRQRSRTLPEGVESNRAIREAARPLLRELREVRPVPARLLGLGLAGLESTDAPRQLGLFAGDARSEESERERELSRAVDALRRRFGGDAVAPARLAHERRSSKQHPPESSEPDPEP
ncbi:MAG: DNA polymerase IV [Gemmatimonadota bacterium]|nr:DNA polymerase IV [Gemmatimonadota bacterium]